jgi:hypothetical protein
MNMFPMASFDLISNELADQCLKTWGHWLEGCNRPFGRQSFGLTIHGELLCVAVSASTVNALCGGYPRNEIVELARLCSHPEHTELTRIGLRLWRVIAPGCWSRQYWPVRALVSYSNNKRHKGDIYRFDGWQKIKEVPGGQTGTNATYSRKKTYEAKTIWAFDLPLHAIVPRETKDVSGAQTCP